MKHLLILVASALLIATASAVSADYAAGVTSYKKRNYRDCIRQLQEYTSKTPDPGAYYLMGYASYKIRDFATAREYFRKAYLVDPNFRPGAR